MCLQDPKEKPLILEKCKEQFLLNSREGKLERTLGKWHIRNYLLQEQCKFTGIGANESQSSHHGLVLF